jgi:molybdenum cofactor synthesis domain-containing protein
MTGAPVPPGADAVVMVELLTFGDDEVVLEKGVDVGTAIRPAGDDVRRGEVAVRAGSTVTPAVLGTAGTIGCAVLPVVRRPVVGVFSTGDELVEPGRPLGRGKSHDSNRRALLALLAATGCTGVDLGCVADDEAAIEATLREAAGGCDAVVTSGGVSMGDFDYVKAVLSRIADMRWMQLAIRPAKPLAFGTIEGAAGRRVPVFGLPGNPVSSHVSFELFARPALRRMMGHDRVDRRRLVATVPTGIERRVDGKVHFDRVVLDIDADGRLVAVPLRQQGSHQTVAMAEATGLAVVPDGAGIGPGSMVEVIPLGEDW